MSGVGRNDPRPCGSGKKYKKCCQPSGGVGVGYTMADRDAALAALSEFVDGPGWARMAEEAESEFWDELDPEQTAVTEDEVIALMSEQVFDWWLFFDYEHEPDLEPAEAEPAPPRWAWSGKRKDRKEPVVYGWFALEDERLVFETNSVERAERGRKLVERLAGTRREVPSHEDGRRGAGDGCDARTRTDGDRRAAGRAT